MPVPVGGNYTAVDPEEMPNARVDAGGNALVRCFTMAASVQFWLAVGGLELGRVRSPVICKASPKKNWPGLPFLIAKQSILRIGHHAAGERVGSPARTGERHDRSSTTSMVVALRAVRGRRGAVA